MNECGILSPQIVVTYFLVDRWSEIALQKKSSLCGRVCLAEKEQKKGIVSGLTAKGQLILEKLFGIFNFPKRTTQKFDEYALEFKKWINQSINGPFLC